MSNIKIKIKNLNVYYGDKQALFDVNLDLKNGKECDCFNWSIWMW